MLDAGFLPWHTQSGTWPWEKALFDDIGSEPTRVDKDLSYRFIVPSMATVIIQRSNKYIFEPGGPNPRLATIHRPRSRPVSGTRAKWS